MNKPLIVLFSGPVATAAVAVLLDEMNFDYLFMKDLLTLNLEEHDTKRFVAAGFTKEEYETLCNTFGEASVIRGHITYPRYEPATEPVDFTIVCEGGISDLRSSLRERVRALI
jgi:hypothetical protein